ncbi:MAG: high frequency lysogenization protein HflD [Gammaproteobacteria bacterium]|nr:high frequency lysogenization protein HflD [Gammaproteobacteria bacterium]
MNSEIRDRSIALAGMYQAVKLVQQTAQGERRDAAATRASISSILNTDPESTIAVYGDSRALISGLDLVTSQLSNNSKRRDLVLTGYVITLMHLERKLTRQSDLMQKLARGIDRVKEEIKQADVLDPGIIAALAEVYKDTVSTLQPRIMVQGEESVLRNSDSKNMIRALLLAGMRAAVLWKQRGGNRVRLIFQRKQLLECCAELLAEARRSV